DSVPPAPPIPSPPSTFARPAASLPPVAPDGRDRPTTDSPPQAVRSHASDTAAPARRNPGISRNGRRRRHRSENQQNSPGDAPVSELAVRAHRRRVLTRDG